MNELKKAWPYYGALLLNFYLLPLLIRDMGSGMFLLLWVMPLVCLAVSAAYGAKIGFRLWFGVGAGLLFLPSLPLFYNFTAWVYAAAFGVIALLGNAAGLLLRKKEKKR